MVSLIENKMRTASPGEIALKAPAAVPNDQLRLVRAYRLVAPRTASAGEWSAHRRTLNEPARLHELIASMSPEEREGYAEADRIIADRLERKLRDGEITRLAYFRTKAKMTQVKLADLTGIPQPNISALERTGRISLRMAERLAPALGISIIELLGLDRVE